MWTMKSVYNLSIVWMCWKIYIPKINRNMKTWLFGLSGAIILYIKLLNFEVFEKLILKEEILLIKNCYFSKCEISHCVELK